MDRYSRCFVAGMRKLGDLCLYLEGEAAREKRDEVLCALMDLRRVGIERGLDLTLADVVAVYTAATGHVIGDVRQLTTAHVHAAGRVRSRKAGGVKVVEVVSRALGTASEIVRHAETAAREAERNGKNDVAGKGRGKRGRR